MATETVIINVGFIILSSRVTRQALLRCLILSNGGGSNSLRVFNDGGAVSVVFAAGGHRGVGPWPASPSDLLVTVPISQRAAD